MRLDVKIKSTSTLFSQLLGYDSTLSSYESDQDLMATRAGYTKGMLNVADALLAGLGHPEQRGTAGNFSLCSSSASCLHATAMPPSQI